MSRLLLTWLGTKDFEGTEPGEPLGPVAASVAAVAFDEIHLLSDRPADKTAGFVEWLETRTQTPIAVHPLQASAPGSREIFLHAIATCAEVTAGRVDTCQLTFHMSPDNAMDSVWLLVAAAHYPATLIEPSTATGLRPVVLPFESESGIGKALLARAIHASSGRKGAFIAINCGAIPHELLESELFGHKQGAFTGAAYDRAGVFEVANHGTLFLDELGDVPLDAQLKLLRVIQQREVIRVGSTDAIKVDVRIVAATQPPGSN